MGSMFSWALALVILSVGVTGCGDNAASLSPAAPTPIAAPPPAPVSPTAVPIRLGETVAETVSDSDPPIQTRWGAEASRRFAVAIPASGSLRVRVTSSGPNALTIWVNSAPFWGTVNDVIGSGRVQAGETYEVAVSMHEPQSATQPFELTASLDPQ